MKNFPDYYLEKYSEELNHLFNSYQESGEIPEQVLDRLHLELAGLFQRNVTHILDDLTIAPANVTPPTPPKIS